MNKQIGEKVQSYTEAIQPTQMMVNISLARDNNKLKLIFKLIVPKTRHNLF